MADLQSAHVASQHDAGEEVARDSTVGMPAGMPSTPLRLHDPDLVRLVDAWPSLPGHIRSTILTLIDSVPTPRKEAA